ncbi:urea ABC transporter permease subunit UrtB [Seohaeicola sp. SP36]|uniref:urea ABC transporter permease subunit UrtB n=1 Tax=unclassified Seohaeicola TaxID=2641111 RepID=UPI00237A2C94|nr:MULTISPECIES: urea ABC transporter permease subunit UrtB [unclassified Seohaeicola]MDD9706579.1 urea ABC transporter permease subunit UrtB [Seohaeicola sp. 4SK31]MDD9734285.1 urea ABC transporter permease subunit UrtB [Seohaeicola sp. SP36]
MIFRLICCALTLCLALSAARAQDGGAPLQALLQANADAVSNPSRSTVDGLLAALLEADLPSVPLFLERWRDRAVYLRASDGLFYFATQAEGGFALTDVDTGADLGRADGTDLTELRPNAGVRRAIGSALVAFQLLDDDPVKRLAALDAIARSPAEDQLEPLRLSIDEEPDPALQARKIRLERLLSARFAATADERIAAIESLKGDLGVDARAVLNLILTTSPAVFTTLPTDRNIAAVLEPGSKALSEAEAYARLVEADLSPPLTGVATIRDALIAAIADGQVAGIPVSTLTTDAAREAAYEALAATGAVPPLVTLEDQAAALTAHQFVLIYAESDPAITAAAEETLEAILFNVGLNQTADLTLDALSLASIYFLAAIGLAITFGVMGVINMAHGEFIMMGAYTGYVVQLFIPDYTLSLIVALPLAFAVTFGAGVAMERLVIRWLYHRPLETLLATFGISIALQQLAKNIFGTQARPLTSPDWLSGTLTFNEVVSISMIRVAIFVLALLFLGLLIYILKRTRLGLEVRAVTQNPGMAASMGINPDRINMLTFGLGSGIAGIAGVAIGLYAKVTSEMGTEYIVQSFMTVVVGGVGNVWGTLAGATLIGFLQKGIEFFNPSNTLAAQTYMILFIILFIQFRPKGIIALKGRAAGD